MSEKNERVFRGVWVPVEIWESQSLSWMEKCLWAEISSLGTEEKPCFASNGYLAKMFHSTESSISNMISKLRSLKMIKQISYDGRSRKILAVLPSQTSSTSEVRVHSQVKSDSTRRCNQSQPAGELRVNPQVNIDTNKENSKDTKREFKPLTPLQGEEESSAVASHSSEVVTQSNLFSTNPNEAHASGSATAELKSADGRGTTPPMPSAPPRTRKSRESKPVDEKFIAELQRLNPDKDVEREVKAAQTWLLSRPDRKYTRGFLANWVIRSKNIINPDKFHNNNSF